MPKGREIPKIWNATILFDIFEADGDTETGELEGYRGKEDD